MKRINLFILLVALLCSSSTIAQDSGNMLKSNNEGWKGLRFSYDRTKAKVDVDGAFDYKFNGASVGYVHAFKLAKKVPLFMELGGTINFAKYKETEEQVIDMSDYGYSDMLTEAEASITQLGLKIPLNIVYCVKINDNVSIKPYTGFYVRVNLMAKEKAKLETTISNDLMNDIFYNLGSEAWAEFYSSLNFEEEVNCFDEDEIGREYVWNRAQVGWQIGASLDYKRINIGIGYALDFNEITEKTKCGIFSANIGVNF